MLIRHAPVVLWAIDTEGKVLFSEGSGLEELNLSPAQLGNAGVLDRDASPVVPVDLALGALRGQATRGEIASGDRHFAVHYTPVRDEDGQVTGAIGMAIDITGRVEADQQRAELQQQLQQSQKMEAVGQLAGGVAHDFNNLLQAILGYLDLAMQDVADNQDIVELLSESRRAADRAATLTRQLLTFSRREQIQPEYLDLGELIDELARMLRRVITENVSLTVTAPSELRRIYADRGQVEQVIMNLCINARDAMPEGGELTIEVDNFTADRAFLRRYPELEVDRFLHICVRDTGEGMDEQTRERIFEPFFTTKQRGRGTGLGLAMVYAAVARHSGVIDVDSAPGEGTTFDIYLPAAEGDPGPENTDEPSGPAGSGGGRTILLAEDDESVRKLTLSVLRSAGYRVLVARDGIEGLRLVRDHAREVDAAVLDVIMPGASGREVCEALRRQAPTMPVLFSTGYSYEDLSDADLDEGISMIRKPYAPGELLRKLHRIISAK